MGGDGDEASATLRGEQRLYTFSTMVPGDLPALPLADYRLQLRKEIAQVVLFADLCRQRRGVLIKCLLYIV